MTSAAQPFLLGNEPLTLKLLASLAHQPRFIGIGPAATKRIQQSHEYLGKLLQHANRPIYGVNTGFGALCNTVIDAADLGRLQHNLLMSHACGTGDVVPAEVVRLMLLLKVQNLCYGNSGVHPATVQRLADLYNADVLPVVYTQGSLGASGDLAPLAHLSLPLIGQGQVSIQGEIVPAAELEKRFGWKSLQLGPKEGLALLNGTQFMTAYAVTCLLQAEHLLNWADCLAALSVDAYDGLIEPFQPQVHAIKGHAGPRLVAQNILRWLEGSTLARRSKTWVQDPYSLRCVPQVHGAVRDAAAWVRQTVETEINSVSDNPNVFPADDLVLSGGNFHGQPLAIALDTLALAMGQLGGISERRVYLLLSGQRGLPPFLAPDPGLNSGLMITQYTAAAIVNQNVQLSMPSSAYSITSSNGQEDFVSMGANAAVKCRKLLDNVTTLLAIELINAGQALWLRAPVQTSPALQKILDGLHAVVPPATTDRIFSADIAAARQYVLAHAAQG
jgi:histidine ammonia-lyase